MPVIRLTDENFMSLKYIKDWHDGLQTPSETINFLIKKEMASLNLELDDEPLTAKDSGEGILFQEMPGLTHTKVLFAKINNNEVKNVNWGRILLAVMKAAKDKGLSKEVLSVEMQINTEPYKIKGKGYTFYSELGLSVQGQSAPDSWKEAQRLANKYNIPVEVKFKWREKEGAQYPGKIGIMKAGL